MRRLNWLPILALVLVVAAAAISYLAPPLLLPALGGAIVLAILSLKE